MRAGMVGVEELLLYFLVAPAIAYAGGTLAIRVTMRRIAEHQLGFLRERGITQRFLVFAMYLATPIVFGIVIFVRLLRAQTSPENDTALRWIGSAYMVASVLTVASETWIVVRRKAIAFHEHFARVLTLTVLPETAVLFALIVTFFAAPDLARPLTQTGADALARAGQLTLLGALGAPIAAFFANRTPSLNPQPGEFAGFGRAVSLAAVGSAWSALCMALAFLQILAV